MSSDASVGRAFFVVRVGLDGIGLYHSQPRVGVRRPKPPPVSFAASLPAASGLPVGSDLPFVGCNQPKEDFAGTHEA